MRKYLLFGTVVFAAMVLSLKSVGQDKMHVKDFKIERKANKLDIRWIVEKEVATNYFELEKSLDGVHFKTVAYILGSDPTAADEGNFGCFDKYQSSQDVYYRLKHVDINGETKYSETKLYAIK